MRLCGYAVMRLCGYLAMSLGDIRLHSIWFRGVLWLSTSQWIVVFTSCAARYRILGFGFAGTHCSWALGIGYLDPPRSFHTLFHWAYHTGVRIWHRL